jgi:hypothetical protein
MRNRFSTAAKYECMIFIVCLTAIFVAFSASIPAMVYHECGVLGRRPQTSNCSGGPYLGGAEDNGIKYLPTADFTLNVAVSLEIDVAGGDPVLDRNGWGHGIYVRNDSGRGSITFNVTNGVELSTLGDATEGMFARAADDVTIDSAATITVSTDGPLRADQEGLSTAGLFGWNNGGAGTVEVTQRAGIKITATGFEAMGIYALGGNSSCRDGLCGTRGDAVGNANGNTICRASFL